MSSLGVVAKAGGNLPPEVGVKADRRRVGPGAVTDPRGPGARAVPRRATVWEGADAV